MEKKINKRKYSIAIVISAFNEEESIKELYQAIIKNIKKSDKIKAYYIIFINANSTDNTQKYIEELQVKDKHVLLLNVNHKTAKADCLQLGFDNLPANVDLVFTMDADLQDDPQELDHFIAKIEEGYDLVSGYKKIRLDSFEKRAASKVYNHAVNFLFGMHLHDHNCGFKCFRREVINHLRISDNLHRFITVLVNSLGYRVGEIAVLHHKRPYGKSKYGLSRYLIGFKDAIRVKFKIMFKKNNNLKK